ncbi:MAG: DUF945 family protein [Gammaproteobacteria bacterium]|nr:DUF945 family protein [Gammaproteobacteria bacterium]
MKKMLGGTVIVAGILLGSYAGMGILTKHAIEKTLQDLRETKGTDLSIQHYDKGFFTSKAVLNWTVHLPPRELPDQQGKMKMMPEMDHVIPIYLSICHGPFMINRTGFHMGLGYAHGELALPSQYQDQLKSFFNNTPELPTLGISLLLNFVSQAQIQLSLAKFQLDAPSAHTNFKWLGLSSQTDLSLNLNKLSGSAQLDGFDVDKTNAHISVGRVSSEYHFQKNEFNLYDGSAQFTLAAVNLLHQDKPTFSLTNLSVKSSSLVKDGLFQSELTAKLDKAMLNGQQYGPGHITVTLQNLDAATLAKINQQLQTSQKESLLARQRSLLGLLPSLPALLSKGATFSISNMSFQLPQGVVDGALTMSLPNSNTTNPFQLIAQLHGTGQLNVPVSIVTEAVSDVIRGKLQQNPELLTQGTNVPVTALPAATPTAAPAEAAVPPVTTPAEPTSPAAAPTAPAAAPAPAEPAAAPTALTGEALESQIKNLTAQRLSSLVQSGVLVQHGETYSVDVKLENGSVQLNGKAFVPSMLQF